jgi:hypothetical protein
MASRQRQRPEIGHEEHEKLRRIAGHGLGTDETRRKLWQSQFWFCRGDRQQYVLLGVFRYLVAFPPGSAQDSAMVTWLRIIVSCFCLVLCVLLAALWVRSYFVTDSISFIDLSVSPHETSRFEVSRGETRYQHADHPTGLDHFAKSPRLFPDGVRPSTWWMTYKAPPLKMPNYGYLGIGFYQET